MKNWFEINNKAKGTADIWIYSEIGGFDVNAKSFIDELKEVKGKDLNVHINSLGGSVFDGLAIYNALKSHKGKVTTIVEGIAASIASVIAMAGDTIEMSKNSLFMIHNPFTMAGGDADELRKTANVLDKIRDEIASIYSSKTSEDHNTLIGLMSAETWFNAEETLEIGFANAIGDSVEIVNNYDISKFNNISQEKINSTLINKYTETKMAKKENVAEVIEEKGILNKIKELFKNESIKNDHEEGHDSDDDTPAEDVDWALTYEELKDRVDAMENTIDELKEKVGMTEDLVENAEKEIADKSGELATAIDTIENLENDISKMKATKVDVKASHDPNIGTEKVVDANATFYNAMLKGLQRKSGGQ